MNNKPEPRSPCVSICALNEDDVCTGCFRSGTEISSWGDLDADHKRAVLKSANLRRKAAQPFQLK